jgi:hypothetical protein
MLSGRVVRRPFQWSKRSLTGNAAPELLLYFLPATLFERIRATAQR